MRTTSIFVGSGGILVGGLSILFFWLYQGSNPSEVVPDYTVSQARMNDEGMLYEERSGIATQAEIPRVVLPESMSIPAVPFTMQAPNGEWSDPLFQDGCEEASLIMAAAWVNGTALTKAGVKRGIRDLSAFEVKQFGQAVDASLADTQFLLNTYFGITTSELRTAVVIDDIKRAVAEGKIVIVPTDGRKLKNPNFKQPGPARHMLVIVGYDADAKEFIVNDPGTRKGEGYRYPEDVLYEAILDYPTGNHVPVTSTDKGMLAVGKK